MISFDNTKVAFSHKSDRELRRARLLFRNIRFPFLVKMGSMLAKGALRIGLPIQGLVRRTIFAQFCGGESIESSEGTMRELEERGVGSILDYSAEGKERETVFDAIAEELVATVEKAGGDPKIPFSVFKVTGIGRYELLEKVSTGQGMSEAEQAEYERVKERVERICGKAYETGTRIFIDAEESWYQDAIDQLARDMMRKYNREEHLVYTTAQLYRHDRVAFLEKEMERAEEEGYFFAVKLVRGAYMEKERKRAHRHGYPDPIQPDKESTDRDFDRAMELCLDRIERVAFCAGTHNESSSMQLARWMDERGLERDHPRVHFSQLLGMGDHISFNLAAEGYNVTKYVPYGPVRDVLPYLIRRAEENTSVRGQSSRELQLIERELKRRKEERKGA